MFHGPVTVTPTFADATSGVAYRTVSIDGADPVALTDASVVVDGDGTHTVIFRAKDQAGNSVAKSAELTIDTVAPTVVTPEPVDGAAPRLVTPNADRVTRVGRTPLHDLRGRDGEGHRDGCRWHDGCPDPQRAGRGGRRDSWPGTAGTRPARRCRTARTP